MQGIGFTTDNVRAILLGRKTVTRRLGGLGKINEEPDRWHSMPVITDSWIPSFWNFYRDSFDDAVDIKPRYRAGQTYYLTEKWAVSDFSHRFREERQLQIVYAAGVSDTHPDGNTVDREWRTVDAATWKRYAFHNQWRSGMMMPEWASRRKLTMLDVRPGRLHEITGEDAIAEGLTLSGEVILSPDEQNRILIIKFAALWDSINPKHYWSYNDWVFRNEFMLEPL